MLLDAAGVTAFVESVWPGAFDSYEAIEVGEGTARVRLRHQDRMLRPGGTVSGPSLMALADLAMWVAVLAVVGPVAMTVTTHLDIDFLRFVGPRDVFADVRLLKVGQRIAVGEILMTADGASEPCAACVGHVFDPTGHRSSFVSEWRQDGFLVTDDRERMDLDVVHGYLSGESYWAKGRARTVTETATAASWCFSLIDEATGAQVGFARLLTDDATFGWLADVFVLPAYQGRRLGHFLVGCVLEASAHVRRLFLGTRDAHRVYADLGFTTIGYPDRLMEILREPLAPPV